MIDSFQGEYHFLSNFYPCNIVYEGVEYPTTEHAYQAAKTLNVEKRQQIALMATPCYAKRAGKIIKLRPDWEEVNLQIMYDICKLKFSKSQFTEKLKATGKQELIEGNTWNDTFWGRCKGKGQNHLGKILIKIRSEIS